MNNAMIEKNWTELKAKIKSQFGKFSDSEIDGFKSDLSQLGMKIEKTYGLSKDVAERQFSDFKKSVQSLIGSDDASANHAKTEHSKTDGAKVAAPESVAKIATITPAGAAPLKSDTNTPVKEVRAN